MDFSEEQTMNIPFVRIIFMFSVFAALTGFGIVVATSYSQNEWEPEMILVPFALLASFSLAYFMVFRTKLETSVASDGFSYRYFPFVFKKKTISFNEILAWQLKPFTNIFNYGGYGYRRNILSKKTSYIFNKSDILELKLKNGRTIFISTLNSYMLGGALRKYLAEKELK